MASIPTRETERNEDEDLINVQKKDQSRQNTIKSNETRRKRMGASSRMATSLPSSKFDKVLRNSKSSKLIRSLSYSRRSSEPRSITDCQQLQQQQQEITIVDPIYTGPADEHEQLEPITLVCEGGCKWTINGVHEDLKQEQPISENIQANEKKQRKNNKRCTNYFLSKIRIIMGGSTSTSKSSLRMRSVIDSNDHLDDMTSTKIGSFIGSSNCPADDDVVVTDADDLDAARHLNETFCLVVNSTMFYHSQCSVSNMTETTN